MLTENREISERLTETLTERAPEIAPLVKPALDLACQQLEILCPALIGGSRRGLVATLGAHVNIGTWVMVFANQKKVLTIQMLSPPPRITRGTVIEDCVAFVNSVGPPNYAEMLAALNEMIDRYGGKPGGATPTMNEQSSALLTGLIWAPLDAEARAGVYAGVEQMIGRNLCPLTVGLIGRGSQSGLAACWPLNMWLAPYIESVMTEMEK